MRARAQSAAVQERIAQIRKDYALEGKALIVGVDRSDYTKGICDKFRAVDHFLTKYPQYQGKFVLFQLGQASRMHVQWYKELNDALDQLATEVNAKYARDGWVPIVFTRDPMPHEDIIALYRMADGCIVSSLHDGMNLVAKEFVSARPDNDGVLVLSQFTGAARELTDAVLINPYDNETFAEAILQALMMPKEEREKRMIKMRQSVEQ